MSGSVCSSGEVYECNFCGSCQQNGFQPAQCCGNWVKQLNFTKRFIDEIDSSPGDDRFSVVAFSTKVHEVTHPLGPAAGAKAFLDTLVYAGGYTNTGDAIQQCYETMKYSLAATRVIVVVTDGTATAGRHNVSITGLEAENQLHQQYAEGQAENVRDAEIVVIPVAVNTISLNLTKLIALTSNPSLLLEAATFNDLDKSSTVQALKNKTQCGYNTSEAEKLLLGNWNNISYDNFETGITQWYVVEDNTVRINLNGDDTRRVMHFGDVSCPSGEACIGMYGDSVFANGTGGDSYLEQTIDIGPSRPYKVRVQFDYLTENWTQTDHFHLDIRFNNGIWIEHSYHIAINFNNRVQGTMEKWFDVPSYANHMDIRFHVDARDELHYKLFIDDISVKALYIPV
jgi:hypothetical protein